jgi:glycosyltransferase A (GT-A) superfamily protein (DUF2064 family)
MTPPAQRLTCLLIMAKAPVPGLAKTRLTPPADTEQAAAIAAASLLDTLDAALATPGAHCIVAMTGDLTLAASRGELAGRLSRTTMIPQRGENFAERLANAHADAAACAPGLPVLQIGMDSPQVDGQLLASCAAELAAPGVAAVLGPATDGGFWVLGLRDAADAEVLYQVPMSTADTGVKTLAALDGRGRPVRELPMLSDVDTMADAVEVARLVPGGRFAAAVAEVSTATTGRP